MQTHAYVCTYKPVATFVQAEWQRPAFHDGPSCVPEEPSFTTTFSGAIVLSRRLGMLLASGRSSTSFKAMGNGNTSSRPEVVQTDEGEASPKEFKALQGLLSTGERSEGPTEILPHLLLGGSEDALDVNVLLNLGVTHVINLAGADEKVRPCLLQRARPELHRVPRRGHL